ncbi:MAG: DNA primase [Thermoleophilaceae bacterium]
MALYTRDSIERTKEAVDMVELVGARTDLRRVGARYTGRCPFHEERTPSFSVSAEHKLYHCFGCGESGDAIGFVSATEALDFPGAVEFLADRYGVELEREDEDPRQEERWRRRERLLTLLERATAYYERYLWDSREAAIAREHLAGRGLGEEVLRRFRVGFAPGTGDRVLAGALRDGFTVEEATAAGLASTGRGGAPGDRFRDRITFPLADARGRVLGFGARAVREEQRPKYLNTSENELYHKGRQLFGIDHARAPAARAGRVVVVEGYTDVLALSQAGLPECVAIMGTALTPEQLAELSRTATTVLLALDADRAGRDAMLRVARGAAERDVELLVVDMPEGRDPAELVAADGVEAVSSRLAGAMTVPEFEVRGVLADADLSSPRGRDRALAAVRPLVEATPERSAVRDELVRMAADRLDVPVEYLRAGARAGSSPGRSSAGGARRQAPSTAVPSPASSRSEPGAPGGPAPGSPVESRPSPTADAPGAPPRPAAHGALDLAGRAECAFLAMCLAEPSHGRSFLGRVEDDHFSSAALRGVRDHLREHFEDPLAAPPEEDPTVAALVREVAMRADAEPFSEAALRLGFLQLDLRRVERQQRGARQARDHARQRELAAERDRVQRDFAELMGQTA